MPDFKKDESEIGSLWRKTSASGMEFLSGEIQGVKVVCFPTKKPSERGPAYRVLLSKPMGERPTTKPATSDDVPW